MKSLPNTLLKTALLIAVFYAGMRVQAFLYDDLCLDLGGGRNPENYPICVIEQSADFAVDDN
ncbi:MAG: hypothetical protein Q4A49_05080 [Neisseria sp.]|nr:hypothetical protein [Neisseria sp.]